MAGYLSRVANISLLLLAIGTTTLACALGSPATATPVPVGDPDRGKAWFVARMSQGIPQQPELTYPACADCHTIQGLTQGYPCPDLTHIGTEAVDRLNEPDYTGAAADAVGYLRESIVNPYAYTSPHCIDSPCDKYAMPSVFGQIFTAQQVSDLVVFLLSQK